MIDKTEIDNFLQKHEGNITPRLINLTTDQVEIIEALADQAGVSFKDMAMVMLHVLFQELDAAAGQFFIEEQARRN